MKKTNLEMTLLWKERERTKELVLTSTPEFRFRIRGTVMNMVPTTLMLEESFPQAD